MKVSIPCAAALALFPLVSGVPAPVPVPAPAALHGELDILQYARGVLEARELRPRQTPPVSPSVSPALPTARTTTTSPSTSAQASTPPPPSTTTTPPPSTTSEPPSTPPPPSTTTPTSTPTSVSQIVRTTASKTQIESTQENGEVTTRFTEVIISITDSSTPTPSNAPPSQDNNGGGVSTSTIVGLSVAGGLAVLGAIAFIAWKMTRKRFSQFDTDDGVINWPDLQKDPAVAAPRAAPSVAGAASITNSTVDLAKDPYAVPPLPQNGGGVAPYRDDGSGFYDPYRGPVPQTFSTPPTSTDGHHQQGWAGGEAIPMSTYASGRTSPGPNYAYGGGIVDPMQRTGTPVQRIGTPVQRMATPVGGAATFHEIVRAGTPGGGAVPYRTGTPGYGYGGR